MTAALAPVDQLRALPYPLALATLARLEEDLGVEAVAALRYELDAQGRQGGFWARPVQLLPDPAESWATCVITGEYGTGKTWMAVQLFLREILAGRSERPRIICASKSSIEGTIVKGPSGILRWLPPDVPREWLPSKGHAGELWIAGVKIVCLSADAPGQAIGEGSDLDLRDDVAKWVISCGAQGAQEAWTAARKSCREGLARAIVPTTPDGIEFIRTLLAGERRVKSINLGKVEDNRGNLAANFVDGVVQDLRDQGQWMQEGGESPFARPGLIESMRRDGWPVLVDLAVAIDPSRSAGRGSCEVGISGGGRDARDVVHVRHDRSAVLDAGVNGWPAVAWDLAEELQREHPGAPIRFVLESNTGSNNAELLRAEERARRKARGEPGVNQVEVVLVKASKNKCERARLPAMQAALGQVTTARGLTALEAQLRALTPDGKKSDRADAMVHLVRNLAGLSDEKEIARGATEQEQADEAAEQCAAAADMNALLVARRHGAAPTDPGPMKVEGAPPGDARYAGPPPRAMARPGGWRTRTTI
ncbi:MAG: hypothetical protein VW547_15880 [Alphaproteobacteria bacterium]